MRRAILARTTLVLFLGSAACWACATIPAFFAGPDGVDGGASIDAERPDAPISDGGIVMDVFAPDGSGRTYRMFVTEKPYPGDFDYDASSVVKADDICRGTARTANLEGDWRALIWPTLDASPASRIAPVSGGWYQVAPDGGAASPILAALDASTLLNPVLTERGLPVTQNLNVWTGGTSDRTDNLNCTNWSNGGGVGTVGIALENDVHWLSNGSVPCSSGARLYCVEQFPR